MSLTLDQLESEATRLTPAERHALISRLRDLDDQANPELAAAWDAVIRHRVREIRTGTINLVDYDQMIAQLETRYAKP